MDRCQAFREQPSRKTWNKIHRFIRRTDVSTMDLLAMRDFIVRFIDRCDTDRVELYINRISEDFTNVLFEIDERVMARPDAPKYNPFPYLSRS